MIVLWAGVFVSVTRVIVGGHVEQRMIESDACAARCRERSSPSSGEPVDSGNDHCLLQSGRERISRVTASTDGPSAREDVWDLDTDFITDRQEQEQLANQGREWALAHAGEIEEHAPAAEHGGGHEGDHHHEGGEATVMAWMLLGAVAFIMIIFYMVHSPDADIRKATWVALSSMVSIFCSVMIFNASKAASVDFFGETTGDHHSPPNLRSLYISLVRLALYAVVLHSVLIFSCNRKWLLKVCGTTGAHIVGFAAIDAFGTLQQFPPFSTTPVFAAFVIPLTVVGLILNWAIVRVVTEGFARAIGTARRDRKDLEEQVEETENEFAALVVGLITSLVVRFWITGHLPPVHGAPRGKTTREVWLLGSAAALFGALVVIVSNLLVDLRHGGSGHRPRRIACVTCDTLAMTMGWCTLYWGQWFFWNSTSGQGVGEGDKMTARMLMAMLFSVLAFGAIYVVDFLADRAGKKAHGLRELIQGLVLTLGLSWEAAFVQAFEGVSSSYGNHFDAMLANVALTGLLCGLVMPAWALYIFPNAVDVEE